MQEKPLPTGVGIFIHRDALWQLQCGAQLLVLSQAYLGFAKGPVFVAHQAQHRQQLRLGGLMLTEARAIGRQNPRGHLQHSKGSYRAVAGGAGYRENCELEFAVPGIKKAAKRLPQPEKIPLTQKLEYQMTHRKARGFWLPLVGMALHGPLAQRQQFCGSEAISDLRQPIGR